MQLFTPTTIAIGILTPICLWAAVLSADERTVAEGKRSTQLATFDFGVEARDVHLWPQLKDKAGNFYGTTNEGGEHGQGVIFRVTPQDEITIFTHPTRPVFRLFTPEGGFLYGVALGADWRAKMKSNIRSNVAILKFAKDGSETLLVELPDQPLFSRSPNPASAPHAHQP
ncbi:MAG: hypothetical protein NTW21_11060 [Verrucomicrobia bacterium]|nr:hypothetical protein [Verrucomicrobiota bacterium]